MKRSCALALSAATLFLATSAVSNAQAVRPGQQCRPAVANPSMYGNCHLRIVGGEEVCRCAILPQALRRSGSGDRDDLATGSITSPQASGVGGFFEGSSRSTGAVGASTSTRGSAPAAGSPAGDVASDASGGGNGRGQGPGNNNGLGNGSEPADNTSSDVKGSDPSNPGAGNGRSGNGNSSRGGNGNGAGRGGRS